MQLHFHFFVVHRINMMYNNTMGVGREARGPRLPWILKLLAKKVVFSISRGKNQSSPLLAPWKNFGKIPNWPPLETIFPTPMNNTLFAVCTFFAQFAERIHSTSRILLCKACKPYQPFFSISSPTQVRSFPAFGSIGWLKHIPRAILSFSEVLSSPPVSLPTYPKCTLTHMLSKITWLFT